MQTLSYYSRPGIMTSAGRFAPVLAALPADVAELAAVAQGLLIHEFFAERYGVELSEADRASVQIRPVNQVLEQVLARDDRPLTCAREPATRLPVNCRHFTVLMTAMLRAQGRPARARCGFGGYFTEGRFEDHWVCEYWDPAQASWKLIDAQIDERQLGLFGIDFDVTDVPRDRFLVAGQAWQRCRAGAADPGLFGLSFLKDAGYPWIIGNMLRDAAALARIELLPWDVWGAMTESDGLPGDELGALFDRLAALTQAPDDRHAELLRLGQDDALRVPPAVYNLQRGRDERIGVPS
ncbi:MAG TPA: transglutaminase domain-containing protein [Streptosporangiaceae bacterium]